MFRRHPLDDRTIEAFLSGDAGVEGLGPLAAFLDDVQLATDRPAPVQGWQLVAALDAGFSVDRGDLAVTAGSNATGPAPQASGLPNRRTKHMIEGLLAKLAAMGLAAKVGLATGALALSGTAVAATGTLPAFDSDDADVVAADEEAANAADALAVCDEDDATEDDATEDDATENEADDCDVDEADEVDDANDDANEVEADDVDDADDVDEVEADDVHDADEVDDVDEADVDEADDANEVDESGEVDDVDDANVDDANDATVDDEVDESGEVEDSSGGVEGGQDESSDD